MDAKPVKPPAPRQQQALDFIRSFLAERHYAPSIREIADHLGLKSLNYVYQILWALEARGLIRTTPGVARSIVLLEPGKD